MPNNKNNNISQGDYLAFEEEITEIDRQISELTKLSSAKGIDYSAEIRALQKEQVAQLKRIYSSLSAWQTVQVARHPKRPLLDDYLNFMVNDFHELHGDRCFGDDRAMITGLGQIGTEKVLIVGQNKGKSTKEKIACNFGCANPEGYRKAIAKMQFAAKYNIPIVTFIDTPGAYPGIGAEQRGQAQAIAVNLLEMSILPVPDYLHRYRRRRFRRSSRHRHRRQTRYARICILFGHFAGRLCCYPLARRLTGCSCC